MYFEEFQQSVPYVNDENENDEVMTGSVFIDLDSVVGFRPYYNCTEINMPSRSYYVKESLETVKATLFQHQARIKQKEEMARWT